MSKLLALLAVIQLCWTSSLWASEILLQKNWFIQDSNLVTSTPQDISTAGFSTTGWIQTQVPSTVMGAIVSQPQFLFNPFWATNLKQLPGSGSYYDWKRNFGNIFVPPESPFGRPWYYRTEFVVGHNVRQSKDLFVDLKMKGITYSAEIWINGTRIADRSQTAGTYRTPVFNITNYLKPGPNALVVLVWPPQPTNLTASWVDWNPTPQDKNMGLWQDVSLKTHGGVSIEHPLVSTHLISLSQARLTVEADVINESAAPVTGTLSGQIGDISFSRSVFLQPSEKKNVLFTPDEFNQLIIMNPRLWWPVHMGLPNMYQLKLSFQADSADQPSDISESQFGIREVTSELNVKGSRLFKINGRSVHIRGAGWASDLFLRFSADRIKKELEYARDMGLNTIRLEGRFEPEEFLNQTDRLGLLVMTGWVCCNAWQDTKKWPTENNQIAAVSIRDQIYQFRSHPSVFTFLYGSDEAPEKKVEAIYLKAFQTYHWPTTFISSAADSETSANGKSGFKMNGPYGYAPPSYWFLDKDYGGAWGFNTETSPGPSIPPIESLKQFIPADHLWPIDDVWNFHTGVQEFGQIDDFRKNLALRYGPSQSAEDFAYKGQLAGYEDHRAMFEAFNKNKYSPATGIIQWMLNNSWPSLIWHLYDYYLRPGGAYFGVKKANQALHLMYAHDDNSIYLINHDYEKRSDLLATIDVLDCHSKSLYHKELRLSIESDTSQFVQALPALPPLDSKLYFIKLTLKNSDGRFIDDNFYWLSTQTEQYDWAHTTFVWTPILREGDLTDLRNLEPTQLKIESHIDLDAKTGTVDIQNTGAYIAFFVHLKLMQDTNELLPVIWQDNYISLLPGEKRHLEVRFGMADQLSSQPAHIEVQAPNLIGF